MNGREEEIYNILYKKKEIDDQNPKLRTEDDKLILNFSLFTYVLAGVQYPQRQPTFRR